MTNVCIRREEIQRQTCAEGRQPCEDGGRHWTSAATAKECLGPPKSWKRQGRDSSLEVSEKVRISADTMILDF